MMKRLIPEEYRPLSRMILAMVLVAAALAGALVYLDRLGSLLSKLAGILSPFMIGGALAFIQMPLARRVELGLRKTLFRKRPESRAPRTLASLLSILVLLLIVLLFLNILLPQVIESGESLVKQVTDFVNENDETVNDLLKKAGMISEDVDPLNSVWQNILSSATRYIDVLPSVLKTSYNLVYSIVFRTLVGLIVSFYFLADSRRISRVSKKICYALWPREKVERLVFWTRKANRLFAGFTVGKLVDSLIVGVICYVSMLLLGLEYPLIISVVVGVTNVLPFFGPFIGAVPSILILLIVHPISALKFAIMILVLQQLDGNVIGPKILGDYVGISPLLTMGAILVGSGLFGFVGLVVSVPVCALLYAIFQTVVEGRLKARDLPVDAESYENIPPRAEEPGQKKRSLLSRLRKGRG